MVCPSWVVVVWMFRLVVAVVVEVGWEVGVFEIRNLLLNFVAVVNPWFLPILVSPEL